MEWHHEGYHTQHVINCPRLVVSGTEESQVYNIFIYSVYVDVCLC